MSELHDIHELHSIQESEKGEQPKPLPPVMTPASREITECLAKDKHWEQTLAISGVRRRLYQSRKFRICTSLHPVQRRELHRRI